MTRTIFPLCVAVAAALLGRTVDAAEALRDAIAADYEARLADLFMHFHANPELSFREIATAERLAAELRASGFEVTEGVGGTGVVALLRNGAGPTVMLRADMDGLPVEERSGLAYASKVRQVDISGIEQPVMHACGHDVHMTGLVGAAKQLAERTAEWSGTIVLIGQPAEERASGARAMLEAGLYTRFPKPDYALAFHVWAAYPAGKIFVPQAIAWSSSDSIDLVVHGVGTHGATPHRGIDPVLVAAQIVVTLQSVVSRTVDPFEPAVITVGAIHGGTKHNIIGERVDMQLTVRSDNPATRAILLDSIDRVAAGVARSLGVPEDRLPEVNRLPAETTPPTINDTPTAEIVRSAFLQHFETGQVVDLRRDGMAAEDFAYYVAPEHGVKGVYFFVGGTPEGQIATPPSQHSPEFKVESESAIKAGAEAMVVGALTLLRKEP
jgi:hippurate hydrolase